MSFNMILAEKIRKFLADNNIRNTEEKKMFGGLAFLINGKMCVNASGENLMCRFDPGLQKTVARKKGYQQMMMKGKELLGYCYVTPEGYKTSNSFEYWMNLCLSFNAIAKSSKKS